MRCTALVLLLIGAIAAAADLDIERYEIEVQVFPDRIEEQVTLQAAKPEKKWRLELAGTLKVSKVEANGVAVSHSHDNGVLEIKAAKAVGSITVHAAGSPYTRFSKQRGGFVRTAVTPEITYIRSQYPWYPRVKNDPAHYRIKIQAPEGWLTRSAEIDRPVRAVGLVAAPYVRVEAEGGIDALVAPGHEEAAKRLLAVAARARAAYAEWFGELSPRRFTLVEMPEAYGKGSGYGEADYVLIGRGALASDEPWAEELVAHEVAHHWWGGEVGFRHFASEALAEYTTLRYVERERGEDAARAARAEALDRVAAAPAVIGLDEIRDFGAGMDPRTYRVHAYEKGMLVLAMCEQRIGRDKLDLALRKLIDSHRGEVIDYPQLRTALRKAGAREIALWDAGPIPRLAVEFDAKKSGKRWKVKGVLSQSGECKPWKPEVCLRAVRGKQSADTKVKLSGKSAKFSLTTDFEPEKLIIDPDRRLLATRSVPGIGDPEKLLDEAFAVVNNPGEADPRKLDRTIAQLRALLDAGAGKQEGLCHTGIGRCLFRLGKHDEAVGELEKAIETGGGGPFHRAWCNLRLGCIADLKKDRAAAEAYYRKVLSGGGKGHTANAAQRFLDKPYRGYKKDG